MRQTFSRDGRDRRAVWMIAGLAAALALTAATAVRWTPMAYAAKPAHPADTKTTSSPATLVDRLDTLLRDDTKTPARRIDEALQLLEREKASGPDARGTTSRLDNDVDRLPWLDAWDEPGATPFFGREWDPWGEIQAMRARIDRLFREAWRQMRDQSRSLGGGAGAFSPMGEFEQTDEAYIYRFDLPGVTRDDVKVSVENGRLTVEGKRESRIDEARKGWARREIFYGHFRRDIILPPDADTDRAKTKLENGVLTVEVPRRKNAATPKRELKIL